MFRIAFIIFCVLLASGCAGSSAPRTVTADQFELLYERVGPGLEAAIRLRPGASRLDAESAAQAFIDSRSATHSDITVRAFVEDSPIPICISRFEGGRVTHRFNSEGRTRRIPTH